MDYWLVQIARHKKPVAAIESPEMNILYRGYPNKVIPAVTNNDGCEIDLRSSNATVEIVENRDFFYVKPADREKYCQLDVVLIRANGDVDIIKTIEYRVFNLPDPEIYWGGFKQGGKGNIKSHNFFAKYPPEIPLNALFKVIEWKISHGNDTVSGTNGSLKLAEDLFKRIEKETVLNFSVDYVGPDGIRRQKNVNWTVIPWKEEKDTNPIEFKCG